MSRRSSFIAIGAANDRGGAIANPITGLTPAAYFRKSVGIVITGAGASQWTDQSGNARHLLQATDANRPTLQGDGSLLGDGTSQYMKCNAFTLPQPHTIFMRVKPITWSANDALCDGDTDATAMVDQFGVTPALTMYAGTARVNSNTAATIGTWVSIVAVFNGASSVLRVGATEVVGGNPGTLAAGGFQIMRRNSGGSGVTSNIRVMECGIIPAAITAAQRAAVVAYLNTL